MQKPILSIVIPGYNESSRIEKTLTKVGEFVFEKSKKLELASKYNFEVIFVDDGSTDDTKELVEGFDFVDIISYRQNRGKGYALRRGVAHAHGELIYLCDADLATPINEIEKFLKHIPDYDCVIGSRGARGAKEKNSLIRKLLGKTGNWIIRSALGLNISDTQCGFKMFKSKLKPVFADTVVDRFGIDFDFLSLLKKSKSSVLELPVKWKAIGGSKVTPIAYIHSLEELIQIAFSHFGLVGIIDNAISANIQFLRYALVGFTTNFLNWLSFVTLFRYFEDVLYYFEAANYILTLVVLNFVFHKLFTFQNRQSTSFQGFKFVFLVIFNFALQSGILFVGLNILGFSPAISKALSIVSVAFWNFFALKYLIFNKG